MTQEEFKALQRGDVVQGRHGDIYTLTVFDDDRGGWKWVGREPHEGWLILPQNYTRVPKDTDPVTKPSHYHVGGFECLDVIHALGLDFLLANAFKYIWRIGRKADALEDAKKARYYLDRWIKYAEK